MTITDLNDAPYGLYAWQSAVAASQTRKSYEAWRAEVIDQIAPEVPAGKPEPDGVLTATFTYDAWEFFYEYLSSIVTKRQLVVDVNGVAVEAMHMQGDYLNGEGLFFYRPMADDGSVAMTTRQMPLFDDAGNVTIYSVHVH